MSSVPSRSSISPVIGSTATAHRGKLSCYFHTPNSNHGCSAIIDRPYDSIDATSGLITDERFPQHIFRQIANQTRRQAVLLGGIGWSRDQISLGFDIYHPITVDQARKLLVSTLNTSLDVINRSVELAEYLDPYPFELSNLYLGIDSYKKRSKDLFPYFTDAPDVLSVVYQDGVVTYKFRDANLKEHSIEEPYTTTLRLSTEPEASDPVKRFARGLSS